MVFIICFDWAKTCSRIRKKWVNIIQVDIESKDSEIRIRKVQVILKRGTLCASIPHHRVKRAFAFCTWIFILCIQSYMIFPLLHIKIFNYGSIPHPMMRDECIWIFSFKKNGMICVKDHVSSFCCCEWGITLADAYVHKWKWIESLTLSYLTCLFLERKGNI